MHFPLGTVYFASISFLGGDGARIFHEAFRIAPSGIFVQGPAGSAEVNNVGDLDVLVKTCVGTNLKRAAMADVRIATRNMNRLSVSVLCYPLGTRDGNTAHVLLVMEEVPICPALPQPGQSVGGRE